MPINEGKKFKIFSLSSNYPLAKEIAEAAGSELSDLEIVRFADGEISLNIPQTVRGHHCFVIQSTSTPVNEHLMELLIMIDALKRASAETINIIMPYYGYSRQDRKARSRQPISAKLVADLLQVAGANRVISLDLHAGQIQGFFDIPIDNFLAQPIIVDYIKKNIDISNAIVVSPDHGGATRARLVADNLQTNIAIIDKRRPEPNKAVVMNIIGNIKNKVCILVDDIVDTAGSLIAATNALLDNGAKKVYACCTHAILSSDASTRIKESRLEKLICTNTIKMSEEKITPKIVQLSVGELLGKGIVRILDNEAISVLFEK